MLSSAKMTASFFKFISNYKLQNTNRLKHHIQYKNSISLKLNTRIVNFLLQSRMYTFCKSIYTAYVCNRRHFSEADRTQTCGHFIYRNIVDTTLEVVVVYSVTDQVLLCLVTSVAFNNQCLFNPVLENKHNKNKKKTLL